ncbi:MAG: hypothetical protein Q8K64_15655 [Sediminibacterium sp.]|nr:hypothetical protein [Sediminibacterium sp.]
MKLITLAVLLLTSQIVNSQVTNKSKKNLPSVNSVSEIALPFIGTRWFETDRGSSGNGTPDFSVRIEKNRNVYFIYSQTNRASGKTTIEEVFCGKFQTYLTVIFKNMNYEKMYYKIVGNKIYEVDSNKKIIKSNSCCSNSQYQNQDDIPENKECDCFGELYEN